MGNKNKNTHPGERSSIQRPTKLNAKRLTTPGERGHSAQMFDQAKACEEIASGKSLREVGKIVGTVHSNICKTAAKDPVFGDQYARAMAIRAELDVCEIPEIRERMLRGDITPEQARVAIDSIKWPASKRLPKVYGDRIDHSVDMSVKVTVHNPFAIPVDAATTAATVIAQQSLPDTQADG